MLGVHRNPQQRFGFRRGDVLDVHAAFGRRHGQERAAGAVEQEADVVLLGDLARLGDEHPVHGVPLDVHAEDVVGGLLGVIGRAHDADAAGLAPAAGLHLGLDHHRPTERHGGVAGGGGSGGDAAAGDGHAVFLEEVSGFVFEEVHAGGVLSAAVQGKEVRRVRAGDRTLRAGEKPCGWAWTRAA